MESQLINDLYNLGQTKEQLAKMYGVTAFTITNHITKQRKIRGRVNYSLKDMSDIMTKFVLTSFARNLHKFNVEQQLRFLPDLLRVQSEREGEGDNAKTHLYLPSKVSRQKGISESDGNIGEDAGAGDGDEMEG